MIRIEMQLPPEEAAVVWDAMMSAADAVFEASAGASAEDPAQASAGASAGEFEQRCADAVSDVARAYLSKHRPRTLRSGYELVLITSKQQLERFIHEAGIELDARTNEPKWDGTAMNLGENLDWLLLAETSQPAKAETSPVCC